MKIVLLLILVGVLYSCKSKEMEIDISKFDHSIKKALKGQFKVVSGKLNSITDGAEFDGVLNLNKGRIGHQKVIVADGIIEVIKQFDDNGIEVGQFRRNNNGLIFENKTDSVTTECNWKVFDYQSFLNGTLYDDEHTCSIKVSTKLIKADVTQTVIKVGRIIKSNSILRNAESKKVLIKISNFVEKINDSFQIELEFRENLEDNLSVGNNLSPIYSETVKFVKGPEVARLSTSISYSGDVFLNSSLENYIGKNCNDSDPLFWADSYLFSKNKYELSTCGSDVLNIINSGLKNNLSSKSLRDRFLSKRKNNLFFTDDKINMDFYFSSPK